MRTKEECDAEIERQGILWKAEETEANYKLVYNGENIIIYLVLMITIFCGGIGFLCSKSDCGVEMVMFGLNYPLDLIDEE